MFPISQWPSLANWKFDRLSVTGSSTCAAPYEAQKRPKPGREHRIIDIMLKYHGLCATFLLASALHGAEVSAARFSENPLVTVSSSTSVGDNVNGPSIIRVPVWIKKPLGHYYMYFAHHKGQHIRLAYADSLRGPWKVYEPGVLSVSATAFFRPQPDPVNLPEFSYTHVASPEIYLDTERKKIIMWVHGLWTEGQRLPEQPAEAEQWLRSRGYAQYTQSAESPDGLNFEMRPAITKQTYLRVFKRGSQFYGMGRLGQLLRAQDPSSSFALGPNPFRDGPYANRIRHVALLPHESYMDVFFSVIGDAPEKILHATIPMRGDWTQWKAGAYQEVLAPRAKYECPEMQTAPSEAGEIHGPAKQLRDPALFLESGKIYLFYTVCGEQEVGGAEITFR